MAAATSRTQVGTQTVPVILVAAKAQDGSLTLRIEYLYGAVDCTISQAALIALGNSMITIANS